MEEGSNIRSGQNLTIEVKGSVSLENIDTNRVANDEVPTSVSVVANGDIKHQPSTQINSDQVSFITNQKILIEGTISPGDIKNTCFDEPRPMVPFLNESAVNGYTVLGEDQLL